MRIQFISDIHGKFKDVNIKESDLLCITGDTFDKNNEKEFYSFINWLDYVVKKKVKDIIILPGNHDFILQIDFYRGTLDSQTNVRVITHRSKPINYKGLVIRGFELCNLENWAFYRSEFRLEELISKIEECDILLTHMPRYEMLDKNNKGWNVGDNDLRSKILEIKPLIHAFGHIHESYGVHKGVNTLSINSSLSDDIYPNNIIESRESIVVEINEVFKIIDYSKSEFPNRVID